MITNQLGQATSRRDFLPFGEEIGAAVGSRSTASATYGVADNIRQKFTGYQKDEETQLDFAEARMYENRHGRFTAVDPLLASGRSANPQTFNRYVYVGNNPIITTDPLGLDWYRNGNKMQWSADNKVFEDGSSVSGWEAVQFDGSGYYAYDCEGCSSGTQAYLYKIGGWDFGTRARAYDSFMQYLQTANSFNDPKLITLRHPGVAERGGDAMWAGAAIFNIPLETYNFGAWGVNKAGGNVPYAPTITPDENTSPAGKFFFYGTNVALLAQGGVSAFNGARNLFSASKSPASTNIALGVSENLDDFARGVNGTTSKSWGSPDFPTQFMSTINNPANKIHFNLTGATGSPINAWKAISEGSKGLEKSRATSWELFQIYSSPGALQRTTFYLNGRVVPSPF